MLQKINLDYFMIFIETSDAGKNIAIILFSFAISSQFNLRMSSLILDIHGYAKTSNACDKHYFYLSKHNFIQGKNHTIVRPQIFL